MEDRSCWAVVCVMNTHGRQKLLGGGLCYEYPWKTEVAGQWSVL